MSNEPFETKEIYDIAKANQADIKYIKDGIYKIDNKLNIQYVTRVEFEPVKRIVYGLVSIILIGVVGALITLVLK